jgi:hypothetical protein
MIDIRLDSKKQFSKEMNNLVSYSLGFIEGVSAGKHLFFATIGEKVKEILSAFIDSMARQSPETLHHVYEWHQAGSPSSRLFDITYTVSNLGLSLKSTFRQSTSIKNGSKDPFYNKANLMEFGVSVTIAPTSSSVLAFEDNGQQVFTRSAVRVDEVGGGATTGSFQNAFDLFANSYLSQSFMQTIGINKKFGNLDIYKKNLQAGLRGGKSVGIPSGYRWVVNLGVGI